MFHKFNLEVTDTFGGEANYAWVKRVEFAVPADKRRAIVRKAKALAGWTNWKCDVCDMGDMIEIRPRGACMVAFVTYDDVL